MAEQMLAECEDTFRHWLGDEYDLAALHATLATAACEQLTGDPVWLLLVSGSGNAKTETVQALSGAGAVVTSTVASEGALLSATSARERTRDATGGLLRVLGERGVLVIKDVTSILSMNRDLRGQVLAALREVYDGYWQRNVGVDGGRSLSWRGRLVLVGAVTTAYDTAHGVIAAMGDRFALLRTDSTVGRQAAGRQALANVGHEDQMRAELAAAVGRVLAEVDEGAAVLDDATMTVLLRLADVVTLARTAVERDQRGDPTEAHAPEAPTRFAKMLGQLVRGALAVGMTGEDALQLAARAAGDSVPPVRLLTLGYVRANPGMRTTDVAYGVQRPRSSIDRTLQELHLLGLVAVDTDAGQSWRYRIAPGVDSDALGWLITRYVSTEACTSLRGWGVSDKSGDGSSVVLAKAAGGAS